MAPGVNVEDIDSITLGNGILEFGGLNLGQLSGDVELTPAIDFLDFEAGVPKQLIKRFLIKEGASIKASLAELSAANFAQLAPNVTEEAIGTNYVNITNEKATLLLSDWLSLAHGNIRTATGTATGGTTTTLIDTSSDTMLGSSDDYWNGCILEILEGTNAGQKRKITDYVESTKTVTVSPAFTSIIDTTSVYRVIKAQPFIATTLIEPAAPTDSVLKVADIADFAISDSLKIGGTGGTSATVHASTAPSGHTITLTAAIGGTTTFPVGTLITDTTTSLMVGTDYDIEAISGKIRRISGGKFDAGQLCSLDYAYNKGASTKYHFGGKTTLTDRIMKFTHTRPDGKNIVVYFHKAMLTAGIPLKFNEDTVSLQDVTITAMADTSQPAGKQLYYVEWES